MSLFFEYPSSRKAYSTTTNDPQSAIYHEFGRLIHAAVINRGFCEMLLANPIQSIERGYKGETFQFSKEIKDRITGIQAASLEEFSAELLRIVNSPVVREVAIAHYQ